MKNGNYCKNSMWTWISNDSDYPCLLQNYPFSCSEAARTSQKHCLPWCHHTVTEWCSPPLLEKHHYNILWSTVSKIFPMKIPHANTKPVSKGRVEGGHRNYRPVIHREHNRQLPSNSYWHVHPQTETRDSDQETVACRWRLFMATMQSSGFFKVHIWVSLRLTSLQNCQQGNSQHSKNSFRRMFCNQALGRDTSTLYAIFTFPHASQRGVSSQAE